MQGIVKFDMRVPALVKRVGDMFVAECSPLDVFSQGPTKEKALDNLVEALQLFVETCFEMGTLGEVFKECGFHPGDAEQDVDESNWLHIPLSLVAANAQAQAA